MKFINLVPAGLVVYKTDVINELKSANPYAIVNGSVNISGNYAQPDINGKATVSDIYLFSRPKDFKTANVNCDFVGDKVNVERSMLMNGRLDGHIVQGHVLVMSSFAPKAPWSKEFAMARNSIIYGMASHIYVAQSDDKGGTWSGVMDGLRKNRAIYVRWPEAGEKNANVQLIHKGAAAVDINGNIIKPENQETEEHENAENMNDKILKILSSVESCSSKDILIQLGIGWSDAQMKKYLESMSQIEKRKIKNRVFYCLKDRLPDTLPLDFE